MADDDRALRERLAALEAEVKADADETRSRRSAAAAKLRDQRVTQSADHDARSTRRAAAAELTEREELRERRARRERSRNQRADADDDASAMDLGGALELASKANRVKQELTRAPRRGDKSWIASGALSLFLGPVGWLYAGSLREAVPASAAWIALGILASKILPLFLLMPVVMVAFPLSAIAGVVYAMQYNRAGERQRLFDRDKDEPKQLRRGEE